MKRIVIIPGHEPKAKGAYNNRLDVSEYDVVTEICTRLMAMEDSDDVDLIMKKRNTYSKLAEETLYLKQDLAIEVHLNAYNGVTQGTETLYYHTKTKSKQYAQFIQNKMVKYLKLSDRKILARTAEHNGAPFLRLNGLACVIVEPFFLDSITDKATLDKYTDLTVKALHEAIIELKVL